MQTEALKVGHGPEGQEQGAGAGAHLVVRYNVGILPPHAADVAQQRVALLPAAHQDGIGVHLQRCTYDVQILDEDEVHAYRPFRTIIFVAGSIFGIA